MLIVASYSIQMQGKCLLTKTISHVEFQNLFIVSCERLIDRLDDARLSDSFEVKKITRQINNLVLLESVLPLPAIKFQVIVDDSSDEEVQFVDRGVRISRGLLLSPLAIEKYLIMAWLRELVKPQSEPDHLSLELVGEVLSRFMLNQSMAQTTWIDGLMTFKEYCSWSKRSLAHREHCKQMLVAGSSETQDQPTIWGFRDVFANELLRELNRLTPPERRLLIQRWARDTLADKAWPTLPDDYNSLTSFHHWYQQTVAHWSGKASPKNQSGYELKLNADIELLVEGDFTPSDSDLNFARIRDNKVYSARTKLWTGFYAEEVSAKERLYIGCQWPRSSEVYKWRAEGAGFIKSCKLDTLPTLDFTSSHATLKEYLHKNYSNSLWINVPLWRRTAQIKNRLSAEVSNN